MDLFFECVVDHLKCIISDHGSLVNDDGIVLPDVILEKRVDSVSLQIGVELLPVVCCKKTLKQSVYSGQWRYLLIFEI